MRKFEEADRKKKESRIKLDENPVGLSAEKTTQLENAEENIPASNIGQLHYEYAIIAARAMIRYIVINIYDISYHRTPVFSDSFQPHVLFPVRSDSRDPCVRPSV